MKSNTLAILIAILIVPILSIGQTVTISDPTDVEVGISQTFTASVTSLPTGWNIINYEWTYSSIGLGISGPSRIVAWTFLDKRGQLEWKGERWGVEV